ncbi:hypothetical protein [Carboxylicivirga caseinilyticus]|uniref:hypothetical protein n=1 Tax=Carboxylicivirga caseinilyticus TaxID=3417572 RepID=UPI003D336193|nr:hypothetical protein [Marinilabiliaceae bacterium A049]
MPALALISVLLFSGIETDSIRLAYHNIDSDDKLNKFISILNECELDIRDAYLASAYMQKAQYIVSPYRKLQFFNKGKKLLENYIEKYPNCIDGRYVRFLVQTNAPFFLGYSSNKVEDKEFITNKLDKSLIGDEVKDLMNKNINQ